jgi:hypothetical protein
LAIAMQAQVFKGLLEAPSRQTFGSVASASQCHLSPWRRPTLRSSGPPPGWHLAREPASVIIRLAGQAPTRRCPLSSNVRPHGTRSMKSRAFIRHRQKQEQNNARLFLSNRSQVTARVSAATPELGAFPKPPTSAENESTEGPSLVLWPQVPAARPLAGGSPSPARGREQEIQRCRLRGTQVGGQSKKPMLGSPRVKQFAAAGASRSAHRAASDVRPNPSLERTSTGLALGPRTGQCHHPLRGPSTNPAVSAQLKR